MKVLQLSKFYPPIMGGIESVAWELSRPVCMRHGCEVEVLCATPAPRHSDERDAMGVPIVRAGSLGTAAVDLYGAVAMPRQLRADGRDADVIHVHMPDPLAALAVWTGAAAAPRWCCIGTATSCASASRATCTSR